MLYEIKNGFYKRCNHIHYLFIILISALILSISVSIFSTAKYNQTRRQIDTAREQLARAEDTNRELTATIDRCRFIVTELTESTNRNIDDIIECIELLEEIRTQVGSLEMVIGDWNTDELYSWYDNRVELPEEMR